MAVMRTTLKDVGSYEAKLLGPFTTRQSICLGAGAIPSVALDYIAYNITSDATLLFVITMVIMAPFIFLGFGSKFCHDMKPEDFVRDYIKYKVMAPPVRLYASETYYDKFEKEYDKAHKDELNGTSDETEFDGKKKSKSKSKESESTFTVGTRKFTKYTHKKSTRVREAE